MFSRRELVTGGLAAAGVAHATAGSASPSQLAPESTGLLHEILAELQAMRNPLPVPGRAEMDLIRLSQRQFLKQSGKFPEQIDVGMDTWDRVIDWHVATLQRLEVTRQADGRYAIRYLTTNIVLKPELPENYVSQGQ
jgi:hypothetical protein